MAEEAVFTAEGVGFTVAVALAVDGPLAEADTVVASAADGATRERTEVARIEAAPTGAHAVLRLEDGPRADLDVALAQGAARTGALARA
jgi:hypothetical protein